ncbi:hypothetical protein JTE88_01980 [Arcanobacterium phocisimile]|uniref:Uncharacterized protein n=2 Tax=Arcanobacterium TaxID=28263 RepID=A0ABX7II92_9ACTO|nr:MULTISPECIES: hypothetical protein [Arcanobacterium]QRV02547.1 hypothetical protein JTE88_01980 [Arcanobacterium phocisimile]USR79752.1 hypothetical protein NG665_01815 [Arcanobacterium pinnipediorum]
MKNNHPHPSVIRFNTEENAVSTDNQEETVADDVVTQLTHQFANNYEQALCELAHQNPHHGSEQPSSENIR